MENFINSADSRETSTEIMEAIAWLAETEEQAERIWKDPSDSELVAIIERVTGNGREDASDFCWGAAGDQWAESNDNWI